MKSVSQTKLPFFRRDFQTLNARAARTALSSNVHQFCKPKSSCFMRERAVKRISFFLNSFMLYELSNKRAALFSALFSIYIEFCQNIFL